MKTFGLMHHPCQMLAIALVSIATAASSIAGSKVGEIQAPEFVQHVQSLNGADKSKFLSELSPETRRKLTRDLILRLKHSNEMYGVVRALGALGQDAVSAIPALAEVVRHGMPGIETAAIDSLEEIGPAAAPELARLYSAGISPLGIGRRLESMAPLPREAEEILFDAVRSRTFEDEGTAILAIAKTNSNRQDLVDVIARVHRGASNFYTQQNLDAALRRLTLPAAGSLAAKLRLKRRLWILLYSGPFLVFYAWALYRLYRRIARADAYNQYVFFPLANAVLAIVLTGAGGVVNEFVSSFSSPGVAIAYVLGAALYSPILAIFFAPIFATVTLLTWSLIGFVPYMRGTRVLQGAELIFCIASGLACLLVLGMMVWTKRYYLPIQIEP